MTPRPRKPGNRDLPRNLYRQRRGGRDYYSYRDPRDGRRHAIGSDRAQATTDAEALNAAIYPQMRQVRLKQLAQPPTQASMLFREWIVRYIAIQEHEHKEGYIALNTLKMRKNTANQIRERMGSIPLGEITTRDCAALIDDKREEGKPTQARVIRRVLVDVFAEAISAGEASTNPASPTKIPRVKVQRSRMTLEHWKTIYEAAESFSPWLRNAMLLALVTGQRRGDLVKLRFRDLHDGYLHVVQEKTGAAVAISQGLRLQAVNASVKEAIEQCRDAVVTTYMLHHHRNFYNAVRGGPISADALTNKFSAARKKSGLEWKGSPPSFHEIRSLSKRLYEIEGVNTKALLGHKSDKIADQYGDTRGHEFVYVGG